MTRPGEQAVRLEPRVERVAELTRTQSDIWTSQRLHPATPLANMGKRTRIDGVVDAARFVRAFDLVVRRCEVLRTVVGDRPTTAARNRVVAVVRAAPPAVTEVIDLPIEELDRWCTERISAPIDATRCVYDSVLIRHGDDDWTWWLDLHHIATDAWSSALIFEATSMAYLDDGDDVDLDEIVDRAYYSEDVASSEPNAEADPRPAWEDEIESAGPQPPIEPYGARGPRTTQVRRLAVPFSTDDRRHLHTALDTAYRTLSRELGLLTIAAMSTAISVNRLDGRSSVLLGVPVHHRSTREARRIVGPLMELYPLTVDVDPAETHQAMFKRVMASIIALLRRAKPGESPPARFEIVLNVLTARYGSFAGMPAASEWMRSGHVDPAHVLRSQLFDYTADATSTTDLTGLNWELDVNASLSADDAAARLPDHFAAVVRDVIEAPGELVGTRSIVGSEELAELAALSPEPTPREPCDPVHVQIARRLRADPSWIVAEHDGEQLTAGELDQRADQLARWLVEAGVSDGRAVGVRMPRGLDVLVAIHGVLRAGGAFVMLSPDEPPARVETIAADADVLLTLDRLPDASDTGDGVALPRIDPDDRAYILYTSGSTGEPKGVPISHRGLADYLQFAVEAYGDDDPPVVALHSRLTVDLTITSVFFSFLTSGLTVVFDAEPITALGRIAADDRITFLKATPSQLELFVRLVAEPRPLRTIVVGGEAFRTPIARRTLESCLPGARIYNEYGPTEAVVGCMLHRFDPELDTAADVPIGAAAPGSRLAVLDPFGHPTPTGAWGELYVQRPGMAEEYVGRPELSAQRFVTLPDEVVPDAVRGATGRPWYRTGDRIRVVRPGVAVYGGRMDDQIKVDGMRLEPGEVEAALVTFPGIESALVRIWQPSERASLTDHARCIRCGLGTDVPGVELDESMVCNGCRSFEMVAPQTERWFRDESDLDRHLVEARRKRRGDVDCLHLLSGGKDSTYALYQLVERGWKVHALTLDNGFVSEGAKENIRRSVADLGITHEFASTPSMNEIFRDSLERHSNVCQGCYKTIYTLAVARAHELGIPVIVTGLSRGQFFETRLVPHQFEEGRFDPDAIDATVLEARRVYHRTTDAVTELLPEQRVFDDDTIFDEIEFVDFYRYVDVELTDLYRYLEERAPWVRPADTGRSTNCLINIAGIQVHRGERGYHNYAEPYSWDVRLGHKTRDEALEELDDEIDEAEVLRLLAEIGYEPKTKGVLTAWYRSTDGVDVDPDAIRAHLRARLPAHAVPAAFVRVDEMPLAASAKVDPSLLPAPTRFDRSSGDRVEPATPLEARLCEIWATVLGLEAVGATDDFFDLGGASLDALEVVEAIHGEFGSDLPDAAVFRAPTVRALATAVQRALDGAGDEASLTSIPALDPQRPPPLSAGEEAMLFEYRMAPDDPRYNVTRVYRIELSSAADFDTAAFAAAIGDIVMTHGPLHTSYSADRRRLPLAEALDVTELPSMTSREFEAFASRQRAVRFDLDDGPLVRVHLCRTGEHEVSLLVALHHISVDAGTFDLVWDQIVERYDAGTLPELRSSYAEHGQWQRVQSSGSAGFWKERSRRRRVTGGLAVAAPSPPEHDGYISRRCAAAPEVLTGPGRTPFASAMAAMAVVMSRYTAAGHVSFGITASTKDHRDAAPLVGYYLNTLPVELEVRPTARFGDLVGEAAAFVGEALPHRAYPFASIVRDARSSGHAAPSVSSMLAYEDLATPDFPGGAVEQRILASGSSVADATFFVQERATSLQLGLEYRGSVIGRGDAERMMSLFESVLLDGSADPGRSIGRLTAGDAAEDIVGEPLERSERTVLDDFLAQVDMRPDHPAVVTGDGETLGYRELADAVQRLLTRVDAASPDRAPRRVGVVLDRSTDLLAAALAAQSAGAAYVPLDPSAPPERLARIAALADLDVVIVRRGSAVDAELLGVSGQQVVALDSDVSRPAVDIDDLRKRIERVSPDDDAYVIFTSGSTGQPRGVEVTHRNLSASTRARDVWYPEAPSRFLVTPSIGFDSSMVGLFWPLATGGTVVLPSDDDVRDIDRIGATIAAHGVTHTLMVPSLYRAVIERCAGQLQSLHTAIVAGEACATSLVALHEELLPDVALVNEYGPTEATVWATVARLDGADQVSIGRPIAGATARIVDRYLTPVPEGVAGELLIAGPGVAKGYLDDPPSTAARFVSIDGRRWYRTGDLVRSVDDRLEFVGRADDQLNVGGTRLEPGEVEAALTTRPEIRDAVVVAAMDPPILVAHVESDGFDEGVLRASLSTRLPNASIPRRFVRHEQLPRNANGKVDRAATARLPVGSSDTVSRPSASADTPATIDVVLNAWRTALDRTDIAADTDFFEIGGDSLSAVEVVTAIGERLDQRVPIATLLSGRTPAGMSELLDHVEPTRPDEARTARRASKAFQVITLRPGATDGPLVLMTPAWDDVFGYQALAAAFPPACAVVALAYVEQPDEPVVTTVDELVREFLPHAMAEIEARSTVAVVGWSVGGVVAVEITERLSAAGNPIELVALIDTFFPGEERHLWSNRWSKYKSLLRPGSFGEALRELRVMAIRRVKRLAERLGRKLLTWAGATLPEEPARTSVGGFPVQALAHHVDKLETPLVFYRASSTNPARTLVKWRTVADRVVDVEIPGRHRGYNSIMGRKGVGLIASDLVGRLPTARD